MTCSTRVTTMRPVIRYRILIHGRLTSRLASSLDAVALEPHGGRTVLVVDVADAAELDTLLQRLGDLGVDVVSLEQQPQPA
jgi:hypothetical protein